MRRTILSTAAAAALLPLLAACTDESPILGPDRFPPGTLPVTIEALIPASVFIEELGRFSGYGNPADAEFRLVARAFGGALDAHTLVRFTNFPDEIVYRRGEETVTDTVFTYGPGRLVVFVDTLGSADVPATLELWELTQDWDPQTATWTLAADTAGVRVAWQQPGGTRGARIAEAAYARDPEAEEPDSVVFAIDAATMQRLADAELPGVLVRSSTPGTRLSLLDMTLHAVIRPVDVDTAVDEQVAAQAGFVFTPEPPEPATAWHAGGVRSARTLFRMEPELMVPGCPPPQVCEPVPLREVNLHRAALRLRPVAVPHGFEALQPMPLTLRTIDEPELGRFAPLGGYAVDGDPIIAYAPGDTLVDIPITQFIFAAPQREDLPRTFALLAEPSPLNPGAPATFGVAWFRPDPELYVVYTLPARPRLR